jgi:predicted RNase H-like HicB family nuclease
VSRERTYSVVLTAGPEAGGFSVSVPALPGCYSQGETLDEALANVREAIELYLEIMVEAGETPPDDAIRVEQVTVAV